jgi:predicted O-linked N-acetylglucosamine transferase (SPINDLY family)
LRPELRGGGHASAAPDPYLKPKGGQPDKIRIAYLSSDFRDHPVACLLVELLERHDRSNSKSSVSRSDLMTKAP